MTAKRLRRRRNPKMKLLSDIRRHASAAAMLRVGGKIPGALRYEEDLDRLCAQAEAKGWGDAAFEASIRGQTEGHRVARAKKKGR